MIHGLNKLPRSAGLGYLMSSYTSHPGGFTAAETAAKEIAAGLLQAGLVVFAPIAYGPGIEPHLSSGFGEEDAAYYRSHEFWMPICERIYQRCDYAIIATTPGWYRSKGIAIEYDFFVAMQLPVHFLDVENDHLLNLDEARERWPEEMDALEERAAEHGMPPYMTETVQWQSQLAYGRVYGDTLEVEMEDGDDD